MKTLLITGASAGIGLATARRFLDAGYRVVNISRRPCPLTDVAQCTADLADGGFPATVQDQLLPLIDAADSLVLIHNAAQLRNDSARDTPSAVLRSVLEVNLVAPNSLNLLCLPHMPAGSSILYVGSTLAEKAVPMSHSYAISKHALIGMMRTTCQDLAGAGIHTACICPGFTDTEMLRSHVPDEAMPGVRAMSAFDRLAEPTEIAETLYWAAANPVINGAVLHANLGQVER